MGCLNGICDTCQRSLDYSEIKACDDVCESCCFEQGIFEDEVSE